MIEINLVPDVKQELIKARSVRAAVVSISIIASIAALAVVAILSIYVFGVQTLRNSVADDSIEKGSAQLASVEDLSKILTIQNQLTKINALNDAKPIDSRIFTMLQAVIPPAPNQVQISTATVDAETDTITLEGQALTYPAVEAFKKTIGAAYVRYTDVDNKQQDAALASDISLTNVSFGEDSTGAKVLRFTISFTNADELFATSVKNPTIVLINGGNVTDSYLGIPKSIFVDKAADVGGSN